MPLLGSAALAMWWTIPDAHLSEFEHWHAHEHFPERLSIPGFRRGARWAACDESGGQFVMYELDAVGTLTSPDYLARLNAPTPWSRKMMPYHLGMVRAQCHVEASFGAGLGGFMATLRTSPAAGSATRFVAAAKDYLATLPQTPGLTGAHLLEGRNPGAPLTEEQRIRGNDQSADWIVLVSGYDAASVTGAIGGALSDASLAANGMISAARSTHRLAYALSAADVAT